MTLCAIFSNPSAFAKTNSLALPHAPYGCVFLANDNVQTCTFLTSTREVDDYDDGRDCCQQLDSRPALLYPFKKRDGDLHVAKRETKELVFSIKAQQKKGVEEEKTPNVAGKNICAKPQDHAEECQSIIASLKECAKEKDLFIGDRLHDDIVRRGFLEKSISVGNALVNMYAKCGLLEKAREVCDNLPCRNDTSWNSMIAGYAQHGHGKEALACFERMQDEGLSPNFVTYTCMLKAIASLEAIEMGKEMHAHIVKEGAFEQHLIIGTAMVDMYCKCGLLAEARTVFDQLSIQNVVSCNALIAGYSKRGCGEEALSLFEHMQREGLSPNAVTFICTSKACGSLKATKKGQELHAEIVKKGILEENFVAANAVVDMYAKCGQLEEAHSVLYKHPARDVVTFSALIAGYVQQGQGEQALMCFEQMQHEGLSPDAVTLMCVLKACITAGVAGKHEEIHAQLVRDGLLEDVCVGSALVDMYIKCGLLNRAKEVFDELPVRNVVAYSSLIAGFTKQGSGEEALRYFERMQLEGVTPNVFTLVQILRSCASIGAADKGEEIFSQFNNGPLERNVMLGTSLLDMYAKTGSLIKALEIFDKLPARDIVAWNALIAGYTYHGLNEEALNCFESMQSEGLSPDEATFSCIFKACASLETSIKGQETHAMIVKKSDLAENIMAGTALLDMYAKCGLLAEANDVFDRLRSQNAVSWNALIGGYAQHGLNEEALDCFRKMQLEGISPNVVTFNVILKACGSTGAASQGQEIHGVIARENLQDEDVLLGLALADMYANCGLLGQAQDVLDSVPVQNILLWNTRLAGYAQLGKTENVLQLYNTMLGQGINPDLATFTIVLNSCSHEGLVSEAQMLFEAMSVEYGIVPNLEQHTCMVDLFCRAGQLDEAVILIKEMLPCANLTVWLILLRASQTYGSMNIGKLVFMRGTRLVYKDSAAYVCISNIFAATDDGG